ncbi:MAG: hypothetical protein MI975_03975 [Cytophagales bacterium]|nr:hypothetical protein [Cytophagales bacterium]
MILRKHLLVIFSILLTFGCSDFKDVEYTVLLPDAGEDMVFFTEGSGTTISLDGSSSSDVNNLGFTYLWEIVESPEGSQIALEGATTATPKVTVEESLSGRITLSMIITRGKQRARDMVNVDVNPQLADILLVNGIDSDNSAILSIPSANITGNAVPGLSADDTYYSLNLIQSADGDGNVKLDVEFNGSTLSLTQNMTALESYTLYLVGTPDAPELIIVPKRYNQNTIPPNLVGLDAINLSSGVEDVILLIDATAFGFGILPVDILFGSLGVEESFGALDYKGNAEILFPTGTIVPLPIWATAGGERISNDVAITLNNKDNGQFGTFILFPYASSELGNRLVFLDNSDLLPQ